MGTKNTREFKMNWFKSVIKQAEKENRILNYDKLLAEFCLSCNSSQTTGKEILKIMADADKIVIENKDVWPKELYDAELVLRKNNLKGNIPKKEVLE